MKIFVPVPLQRRLSSALQILGCDPDRLTNRESRWGAMDFDAHNGELDRARKLAFAAFEVLLLHKDLFLILCTSGGGGWHLFALTVGFHPVEDWSRLWRQVASFIGTSIQKGICEIFPNDGRGLGNAIRCPGTYHPKSEQLPGIVFESVAPLTAGV